MIELKIGFEDGKTVVELPKEFGDTLSIGIEAMTAGHEVVVRTPIIEEVVTLGGAARASMGFTYTKAAVFQANARLSKA